MAHFSILTLKAVLQTLVPLSSPDLWRSLKGC